MSDRKCTQGCGRTMMACEVNDEICVSCSIDNYYSSAKFPTSAVLGAVVGVCIIAFMVFV
jgi:hypothetical protein